MHRYPKKQRSYHRYRAQRLDGLEGAGTERNLNNFSLPAFIPRPNAEDLSSAADTTRGRDWPVKKIALIGTPLLVIAVAAALIMPTLLAAHQAYNRIFVTRMPHLHVVLNAQGTPIIADDSTPSPDSTTVAQGAAGTPQATPVLGDAESTLEPTPTQVPLPSWDGTSRVTILLIGSDTRGSREVARSDTLILVTINPETKQVSMLSIPRDLLVTIPNYGKDKINAAYAYGSTTKLTGPGLAAATIEYNFGVTIDYFAEVDTGGLARIIDTLGGVTLDVATPIKDDEYPGAGTNYIRVLFQTGLQHMDGTTAVHYARTRHDDSDFARGDRQRQLLMALRAQAVGLDLLPKAPTLLSQLGDTFRTDLSPHQLLALAKLGSNVTSDDVHSYSLASATSVSWLPGQPYYLIPNWDAIHKILHEMMSR